MHPFGPVALLALVPALAAALPAQNTRIEVRDDVLRQDVRRFGVNIGRQSPWGASLITSNVIPNPGFEPGHFGMVTHAMTGSTGDRWIQDEWRIVWNNETFGIGQPEDFWNGAEFEIVLGPSKGRRGTVLDYTHENDRGVFYLDSTGPDPLAGDVMFLRMPVDELPGLSDLAVLEPGVTRPGSPGTRAVRIGFDAQQTWRAALNYYMDSYWRDGDRSAGKLQLADGTWRFSVWAKAVNPGDVLRVRFLREREADFLDVSYALGTSWQKVEFTHVIAPGVDPARAYTTEEDHPLLAFQVFTGGAGEEVILDDLVFERVATNGSGFHDPAVNALAALQPGVLRYWAQQLGDSLANLLAEEHAAGYAGFSPRKREAHNWNFRLHDFLELCALVDAEPWFVLPPTWSPEELAGLIEYLAGDANAQNPWASIRAERGRVEPWTDVFDVIHLEYGNEGWGGGSNNDPFFGASLGGGPNLGKIGHDRLTILRNAPDFSAASFNLILGGQATVPNRQSQIEAESSAHDMLGIAPYYVRTLDSFQSDRAIYDRLFASPTAESALTGKVRQSVDNVATFGQGTEIAIYELHFHTTKQDPLTPAELWLRNDLVTGHGGGMALPLHMLTYLREFGMNLQAAYNFTSFSSTTQAGEYIRLWGLQRDLLTTGRTRPAGLALALANLAVRGDMTETVQTGMNPHLNAEPGNGITVPTFYPAVQSFAFRQGSLRTLVLFNLDVENEHVVTIDTSGPVLAGANMRRLAPESVHADNEDEVEVAPFDAYLPQFRDGQVLRLPKASMTVLGWRQ